MIVGVGVAAVLLVVGLIVLGNQSNQTSIAPVDTSQFPTVGEATAPVTIVEYSDYG
jgi:protein-disulfide isomerase